MRCPVCGIRHVPNAVFCEECGTYLLKDRERVTRPLEFAQIRWLGEPNRLRARESGLFDRTPFKIRLRIADDDGNHARQVELSLGRPIRLGRSDPACDIFPELDLTEDLGREHGVSREHTCIYQQGNTVKVEDLASTNGTLLNGQRLDPYIPEPLRDGDQLQIGKLLIQVSLEPQGF